MPAIIPESHPALIVSDYNAGMSIVKLVEKYGHSKKWTRKTLENAGVQFRTQQDATSIGVKNNRKITLESMIGQTFGLIKVIECLSTPNGVKNKGGLWKCECLRCGNALERDGYKLICNKDSKNNGCGCALKKISDAQLVDAKQLYDSGLSYSEISQKIGVSNIWNAMKKKGMTENSREPIESQKWYNTKHDAFSTLTEESAYWIGFLMADGSVAITNRGSYCITLGLAICDKNQVENFKNFVCSERDVKISKDGKSCYTRVISKQIFEDLSKYGVVQNKTFIAKALNGIENNRHFWRGAIDGDGCYMNVENKYGTVNFCGSLDLVTQFSNFCTRVIDGFAPKIFKNSSIYRCGFAGRKAAIFLEYLYSNATISLERKKIIAGEIIEISKNISTERPLIYIPQSVCVHAKVSPTEDLDEFLNSLGVEFRSENGCFVFPSKNFGFKIEDFTQPIFGGDRYKYRNEKNGMSKSGVNVMFFDSSLWETRPNAIKHTVKHRIGISKTICFARECIAGKSDSKESSSFYNLFHIQGESNGGHHFVLRFDGEIAACMTFSKSSQSRNGKCGYGEFCLSRFATSGNIPGAASKLFKYSILQTGATHILTFSDDSYAVGSIYSTLGFKEVGIVNPDCRIWHPKLGTLHKSAWQRKSIPRRIKEIGSDELFIPESDPRTEKEMEHLLGCRHVWDCGKRKWIWKK